MKKGQTPEEEQKLKKKIRRKLHRRKVLPQWHEFIKGLKAGATIKIHLNPPRRPNIK
jgi:hypothetical protein